MTLPHLLMKCTLLKRKETKAIKKRKCEIENHYPMLAFFVKAEIERIFLDCASHFCLHDARNSGSDPFDVARNGLFQVWNGNGFFQVWNGFLEGFQNKVGLQPEFEKTGVEYPSFAIDHKKRNNWEINSKLQFSLLRIVKNQIIKSTIVEKLLNENCKHSVLRELQIWGFQIKAQNFL